MRRAARRSRTIAVAASIATALVAGTVVVAVVARGDVLGSGAARAGRSATGGHPTSASGGARSRVAWSTALEGWPSAVDADRHGVVALCGGHTVVALDPATGATRWATDVAGELTPFYEPALDGTTVLVSATDRFVALDRVSGAVRWEVAAGGEARAVGLAHGDDGTTVAVVATFDGVLEGRDPADGALRWSVAPGGAIDQHLATAPGVVAAVWRDDAGATVRLLDAASGRPRWEQPAGAMVASPAVGGDVLVVADGDGNYHARVRGFGLHDGARRWSTPVPASFEADLAPAVDTRRGEVAVLDHLGTLSLLDLGTGTLRWRSDTEVPALGGRPVFVGPAIAVRNEGREVVLSDRATGRVLDRRTDASGVPEAIAGSGGRLLVAWRRTDPGRIELIEVR